MKSVDYRTFFHITYCADCIQMDKILKPLIQRVFLGQQTGTTPDIALDDLGIESDFFQQRAYTFLDQLTYLNYTMKAGKSSTGLIPIALPFETDERHKYFIEKESLLLQLLHENAYSALQCYFRLLQQSGINVPLTTLYSCLEYANEEMSFWELLFPYIGRVGHWLIAQNDDWVNLQRITDGDPDKWKKGAHQIASIQYLYFHNPDEARRVSSENWSYFSDDTKASLLERIPSVFDLAFLYDILNQEKKAMRWSIVRAITNKGLDQWNHSLKKLAHEGFKYIDSNGAYPSLDFYPFLFPDSNHISREDVNESQWLAWISLFAPDQILDGLQKMGNDEVVWEDYSYSFIQSCILYDDGQAILESSSLIDRRTYLDIIRSIKDPLLDILSAQQCHQLIHFALDGASEVIFEKGILFYDLINNQHFEWNKELFSFVTTHLEDIFSDHSFMIWEIGDALALMKVMANHIPDHLVVDMKKWIQGHQGDWIKSDATFEKTIDILTYRLRIERNFKNE